jgi:hypothetical protein
MNSGLIYLLNLTLGIKEATDTKQAGSILHSTGAE